MSSSVWGGEHVVTSVTLRITQSWVSASWTRYRWAASRHRSRCTCNIRNGIAFRTGAARTRRRSFHIRFPGLAPGCSGEATVPGTPQRSKEQVGNPSLICLGSFSRTSSEGKIRNDNRNPIEPILERHFLTTVLFFLFYDSGKSFAFEAKIFTACMWSSFDVKLAKHWCVNFTLRVHYRGNVAMSQLSDKPL